MIEKIMGNMISNNAKKLYTKLNTLENLALRRCENGEINVINFMHTIKMAVNTDVMLLYKLEQYENIVEESINMLNSDSTATDFESLSTSIDILKNLSLKELLALKLIFNEVDKITPEQVDEAISQIAGDHGIDYGQVNEILHILYKKFDIDMDLFINVTKLLCLRGYCNYRAEMFGMLNSKEIVVFSNIPTINSIYRREIYLLFQNRSHQQN